MNRLYLIIIKILINLDNNIYRTISILATKLNNNIHPKHRITDYHRFFFESIEKNTNILDIGCGIGILACELAKKANKVIAIDKNKESIEIAEKSFSKQNIEYIVGDVISYNFVENFDYIILSNVLEHIKNRVNFLKKIKNFGNIILIRVPMINRSWLTIYKKELGLEYRLNPDHYIEYNFKDFQEELNRAGLKIIDYEIKFGEIWSKVIKF